jgi:PAS domain S-box-containing protein
MFLESLPRLIPRRFSRQLALFTALALGLSLGLFAAYTVFEQAESEIQRTQQRAQAAARALAGAIAEPILLHDYASLGRALLLAAESEEIRAIRVLSKNGATLGYVSHAPGQAPEEKFEYSHQLPPGTGEQFYWIAQGQTDLGAEYSQRAQRLVLFHPIQGAGPSGYLRIDIDAAPIRATLLHMARDSVLAALIALTLSIALLLLFLRAPLAALARATGFARDLTDHLGEQVEVYRGNQELEALGEALNHTSLWQFAQAESLAQTHDRLAAVLQHVPDGLITLNALGHVESANPAAAQLTGYTASELAGMHIESMLPDWQPQWLVGSATGRVADCRHRDGSTLPVEIVMSGFGMHERELWIVLIRDIRARLAHEEALRGARDAAEAANRAKSEFLAAMSHEIRTPMNGVLGMTELALDAARDPEQREQLGLVKSSAEHLLTVINEILDFSKIEAGRLELIDAPFAPRALIEQLVRQFSVQAQAKGLALTHSVDPDAPPWVTGDESRLRQVFINLIGNAIKFTDQGGVHVSLTCLHGAREGQPNLDFAVRDTGIGIAEDRQGAVFEPFVQAEGGLDRRYGGTGLGLAIARRLVEKMRGHMRLESRPGQGSAFRFSACLPATQPVSASAAPASSAAGASLTRLHLIVAEDNLVNQKLIAALIAKLGCTHALAASGRETLALLDAGHFDAALFDVQMPEMDGLELLARLRASEQGTGRHLPVIMLTAHAMAGDRERFLAAGADGYVSKPIRFDALREQLEALTSTAHGESA